MKLAHIILLASAGAWTVLGAGAVAEKSAVSLGPHFSQAASELLDLDPAHFGSGNMLHLRMCRDGNYLPGSCYDIVMGMLLAGEDRVRNVTLECQIKCRRLPGYHCFDTCKRAKLNEVYDGEIAHSLHLLREMLGMRKMTTLERCGLGFLHFPFKLLTASGGALGGALVSAIISGGLYYVRQQLPAPGPGGAAPAAPQPLKAVLLVGCLFFAFLGSIFLGAVSQKLFAYVIRDGEL